MLRSFHAPVWAWLLTLTGLILFVTLGTWQLHRGLSKQQWLEQFQAETAPTFTLSGNTPAPGAMQRAQARGTYLADRQLLQDGQSREGRPGYHVWTPLRLADGSLLLVNRGWIPQPATLVDLSTPPAPKAELAVTGWWRALPEPGIRVGEKICQSPARFPAPVVYPQLEQLQCLLNQPVLPGLLLLDASDPHGFIREWAATGFPPERHFGYALTWYGLGLTALFLFVKLNLKT